MYRLASVHLHSCSHTCPRLSVTIVTATGQRATSGHLPDFGEMARNPATSEERCCEIAISHVIPG
jgi:hypothetical protein